MEQLTGKWWLKVPSKLRLKSKKNQNLARVYFTNAIREAREYLGLFDWNIHIRFWEKPHDVDEVGAWARAEIKYLRATVFFYPGGELETEVDLFETAVHEMLHVMIYPFVHLASDENEMLTHEQDVAEEQTVTRLARVLAPVVFPGLAPEDVIGKPGREITTEGSAETDPQLNTEIL